MFKAQFSWGKVTDTKQRSLSLFLCLMVMGFVSGVPFILTLSTLSIWLAELGFNTKTIGIFTSVSLPYALKFLWAPFIDKLELPFLKFLHPIKRFGFISLILLFLALIYLAHLDPKTNIILLAVTATFVSFFAATHDIVLDTLRIYASDPKFVGGGAASEAIGFRAGMLAAGAGAVYLSAVIGWKGAYITMAICCLSGIISLWYLPNPSVKKVKNKATNTKELFLLPLKSLLDLPKLYPLIGFILTIKIAGTVMNALGAPFLLELGFSKIEYASISKVYGTSLMLLGSFIAGFIVHKRGTTYCLKFSAILQMSACFLFIILAILKSHSIELLIFTLSIESFSTGLLATGFISYLSLFCQAPFIASHFTLLYSFGSLARVMASVTGGQIADSLGWPILFAFATCTIIPALIFLKKSTSKIGI
jgi:PAT family beta-lactamase induction signal transducer AmpG